MATLTIRRLDDKTKARLRIRAAHHGHSMEEEAREILRSALTASPPATGNLADTIRRRFAPFRGRAPGVKTRRDPKLPGFRRMIVLDTNALSELMKPKFSTELS